jgi:hypothetical protein
MRYVTGLTLFCILFSFQFLNAQAPDTLWTKTFGESEYDEGYSVQQTADGGYIITGVTESFGAGGFDVWLIKTNSSGDTLWTRTFGGSDDDVGYSVQQTTDGGYIIVGYTFSLYTERDIWLIKTDGGGDSVWTKIYGDISPDVGYSVQQTTDGGYIVSGVNDGVAWLLKTDGSGNTIWTKGFEGTYPEWANSVEQTTDGGYVTVGFKWVYSNNHRTDVWLIKTDANGDTLWTKTFGGDAYDFSRSVQQTSDEGYIILGKTVPYPSLSGDILLIKTDANGDTLWTKTLGGSRDDSGSSIQQTNDSGYIITGFSDTTPVGGSYIWLLRTDSKGDTLWIKTFGGSSYDRGNSVQITSDGGYIITGSIDYDICLIKTIPDPLYITETKNATVSSYYLHQNYPNPFNPSTTIAFDLPKSSEVILKVFNILGEEVATLVSERLTAGSYSYEWDASNLASGVYLYRLKAGDYVETRKMVVMR